MTRSRTTIIAAAILAVGLALGLPAVATGHEAGSFEELLLAGQLGDLEDRLTRAEALAASQQTTVDSLRNRVAYLESDSRVNQLTEWSQAVGGRLDNLEADRTCTHSNAAHWIGEDHNEWRYTVAPYRDGHLDGEPVPMRISVRRFECSHGARLWLSDGESNGTWHPYHVPAEQ